MRVSLWIGRTRGCSQNPGSFALGFAVVVKNAGSGTDPCLAWGMFGHFFGRTLSSVSGDDSKKFTSRFSFYLFSSTVFFFFFYLFPFDRGLGSREGGIFVLCAFTPIQKTSSLCLFLRLGCAVSQFGLLG